MDFELGRFVFERVLNEDSLTHSVVLLGTLPSSPDTPDGQVKTAIVRIERTALPSFSDGLIATAKLVESTDIYAWMLGWLSHSEDRPDVKINVICPATDVHIRKVVPPLLCLMMASKPVPFTFSFPSTVLQAAGPYRARDARIVRTHRKAVHRRVPGVAHPMRLSNRIDEIVSGRSESEKVLFRSPPETDPFGFLILPDMKWDLANLSSLYLVALMLLPNIKSLRDLDRSHLPLLRTIRREAANVVKNRWGLEATELRLFVHYQPSYYHFHVHIVNANHTGLMGMTVGQAHMLDDIISLLEFDEPMGPSVFQRMTLSYGLGEQHGLFSAMKAAQLELREGGDGS